MLLPPYIRQAVRGPGAVTRYLGDAGELAPIFTQYDINSAFAKAKLFRLLLNAVCNGEAVDDVFGDAEEVSAGAEMVAKGNVPPSPSVMGGWAMSAAQAAKLMDEYPTLIRYVEQATGTFSDIYGGMLKKINKLPQVGPERVVLGFPDGYKWVTCNTAAEADEEGALMSHCGVPSPGSTMYSLRDSMNMPHITLEVNSSNTVTQVSGKGNSEPSPKYQSYIDAFIQKLNATTTDEVHWDPALEATPEAQPIEMEEVTTMPEGSPDWQSSMPVRADVNIVDQYDVAHSVESDTTGKPTNEAEPNDFALPWGGNFPGDTELGPDSNDSSKGVIPPQPRTGKIKAEFHGLPLVIEWEKGDIRKGENSEGQKWERKMHADYGHIPDTEGEDGDGIDVYVGPDNSDKVFVISQMHDGEYDEDKCMLGFDSAETAEHTYRLHYPDNGMNHFGGIEEVPLDDFLTKYMAKKTNNKKRRKKASPAGNNLLEIDQGVARTNDDSMSEFDNIDSGKTNTSEGGDPSMKFGSSSKEGHSPYDRSWGPEARYMDEDHNMNIIMFAKVGKGEDPYEDGVIYNYSQLLKQHQKDVTANWADQDEERGEQYLWLRTTMKTADLLSESAKWYHKNRNKKWKLEDRDKVLHLAHLMMDGATITPLMVSPIGEPKGGCWEGYHRLAAADMLQIKTLPVIVKINPDDPNWQEKVAQHDRQPWVAVDLDGTILADSDSKPKGRPPLGEPLPGARESLQALVDSGARVSIWTARQYFEEDNTDDADWQNEIDEHLKYHQIPYTDIYVGKKPPADVFIDDKAVSFQDWKSAIQEAFARLNKEAQVAGGIEWTGRIGHANDDTGVWYACYKVPGKRQWGVVQSSWGGDMFANIPRRVIQRGLRSIEDCQRFVAAYHPKWLAKWRSESPGEISMEAAIEEEAVVDMSAVDDPAMIGNDDDKADANVRGDGSGTSLNGPAQWTSDVAQGPLSGA